MLKSKISRWLLRSAFLLVAVAAVSVLSAEQANAQYYGGRGVSIGSFGRGISYGNRSSFRSYGGRGFSSYGRGFNSYYRPSYGNVYRGRGYGSRYYGRGGFRY